MTRCGTDFRHQYGIFGGESQTSFTRNATRAGSEEGRLFSQATCHRGFWYFVRSWSREFQVNPRNPAKFTKTREIPRNSLEILPNTCRHNIFESYLGCWGWLLAVNLLIYLKTSSPQRVNNIPKPPGVLRLMLRKTGKKRCKNPGVPSLDRGNWRWECDIQITSWKVRAYRIYARVVGVSENERVSVANEWVFWYKNNECVNTVQTAFHTVICLFYTYRDFSTPTRFSPFIR